MYILTGTPGSQNDAFDTLEEVFGSSEFSADDAIEALEEVLEMDTSEAQSALKRLIRMNVLEEA